MGLLNFFEKKQDNKLEQGLEKTKSSLFGKLKKAVIGHSYVDEALLDQIEETLIMADVGVETTVKIIEKLEQRVASDKYIRVEEVYRMLKEEIAALMNTVSTQSYCSDSLKSKNPYVILVVGVNGVGKTTTIGKLASMLKGKGKSVLLGAADTFRAAAVDQLLQWGNRVNVPVVSHGMNTDPASVAYDAVKCGVEKNADVVIIDTAGRLNNKINLMHELAKIKRVIQKFLPNAPHEILLVLDGSTGQNAFLQAKAFTEATNVNALAITKLDGTSKGGVIIGLSDQFKIPVKYIGLGEKINDLQLFDAKSFVETLFQ